MITVVVLDRKGDFQYLIPMLGGALSPDEMLLVRASTDPTNTYFDNPFEPPTSKVSKPEWNGDITNAIGIGVFNLLFESTGTLLEARNKADSRVAVGECPSLYHLLPEIIALRPKSYAEKGRFDYYSRAEQRIHQAIIQAPLVLGCTRGIPFEEYIRRCLIIIDISKCGLLAADLITHVFLVKLFKWAQYEIDFEQDMRFAVFLDEGERIFGQRQQAFAGESILDTFLRTSRTYGIWCFIGNQTFSTLSPAARKTAGAKIAFSADNSEVRMLAESMGMASDQVEQFKSMEPGQMFVKMGSRPQLPTFLARAPHFFIDRSVPQAEIDGIFEPIVRSFPVKLIDESLKRQVLAMIYKEELKEETPAQSSQMTAEHKVLALLQEAARNPFGMTKHHIASLAEQKVVNRPEEYLEIQNIVVQRELIELFTIKLDNSKGAPGAYTALTEAGRRLLVSAGHLKEGKPVHDGKSGYLHALIATAVMDKLTTIAGISCRLEGEGGKGCDISVLRDGKQSVAVEISHTTSPEHEMHNISRNLGNGWPRVILVIVEIKRGKDHQGFVLDEEKATQKKNRTLELIKSENVQIFTFDELRRMKDVL